MKAFLIVTFLGVVSAFSETQGISEEYQLPTENIFLKHYQNASPYTNFFRLSPQTYYYSNQKSLPQISRYSTTVPETVSYKYVGTKVQSQGVDSTNINSGLSYGSQFRSLGSEGVLNNIGSLYRTGGQAYGIGANVQSYGIDSGLQTYGKTISSQEVSQHTIHDVINKVPVPVPQPYPVPVIKNVKVAQPYPVPVHKPVPVSVKVKVAVPVEKPYPVHVPQVVPYPVKIKVPYTVEKPYPVTIFKTVTVPVEKPVYVKVPDVVQVPVPESYPVPIKKTVSVKFAEPEIVKVPEIVNVKHQVQYETYQNAPNTNLVASLGYPGENVASVGAQKNIFSNQNMLGRGVSTFGLKDASFAGIQSNIFSNQAQSRESIPLEQLGLTDGQYNLGSSGDVISSGVSFSDALQNNVDTNQKIASSARLQEGVQTISSGQPGEESNLEEFSSAGLVQNESSSGVIQRGVVTSGVSTSDSFSTIQGTNQGELSSVGSENSNEDDKSLVAKQPFADSGDFRIPQYSEKSQTTHHQAQDATAFDGSSYNKSRETKKEE